MKIKAIRKHKKFKIKKLKEKSLKGEKRRKY